MTTIKMAGHSELSKFNCTENLTESAIIKATKCEMTQQNSEGSNPFKSNESEQSKILCLVCSQLSISTPFFNLPRFNGSVKCLDPHLWSFYFLTRVICYPKEECVQLLKTFGGVNPSEGFTLCEPCFQTVEQVYNVERQITKLQAKLEEIKSNVASKLEDSWKAINSKDDKHVFDIRKYIRQYFKHDDADDVQIKIDPDGIGISNHLEADHFDSCQNLTADQDQEDPPYLLPEMECDKKKKRAKSKIKIKKNTSLTRKHNKKQNQPATNRIRTSSKKVLKSTKILSFDNSLNSEDTATDNTTKKRCYKYECHICNRMLSAKSSLENHLKLHKKFRKFSCSECKHPCRNQRQLECHLKSRHNIQNKFPKFLSSLAKFVDTSEPGLYKCKFCSKYLGTESKACFHISRDHKLQLNREMFSCHICPALCTTLGNLNTHIQQVHEKRYKCGKCKVTFSSANLLQQHRLEKHEGGGMRMPSICDQCGLKFSIRYSMIQHRKRFHPDVSSNIEKTAAHSSNGGGGVPVKGSVKMSKFERKCQYCEAICCNTKALKEHFKSSHPDLYKYKCEMCDAIYISNSNLKIHVKSVHEKEKVECKKCGVKVKPSSIGCHIRLYCKHRLTS